MRRHGVRLPPARRSATRAWNRPTPKPPEGPQPPLARGPSPIPGRIPGEVVRDLVVDNAVTLSSTTETIILEPVDSGVFLDLLAVVCSNTSASAVRVDFRDARGGEIAFSLIIPAGDLRGFVLQEPRRQTASNAPWTAQLAAAVTDVRVFVQAVKAT